MQTPSPDMILSERPAGLPSTNESCAAGSGDKTPSKSPAPPPSCGGYFNSLASSHRLHPCDVALAVAGILCNVAGPHAGFVTPDGILISPGLNLLLLDEVGAAFHDLESDLLQPLRARAHFIRSRAASQSRQSIDRWTFGRGHTDGKSSNTRADPSLLQRFDLLSAIQQKLAPMQRLPPHPFEYPSSSGIGLMDEEEVFPGTLAPGANHLPSLFSERLELPSVPRLLSEALHREALLCFPVGGMFSRADLFDDLQEAQASQLAALMRGQDMSFPPLHPDQGHGTFSNARVHLWADTTIAQVGTILSHPDSHWNDVLQRCLLWNRIECATPPAPRIPVEKAHVHYRRVLHDLLEIRCHGNHADQRRLALPPADVVFYRKTKVEVQNCLDSVPPQDRPYVTQFHDLLERVLWVFLQFCTTAEAALRFARIVTIHAVEMQQRALQQARHSSARAKSQALEKRLLQLLRRHGPSTLRELQRHSNNLRKANLVPGLEQLMQLGQVRRDGQNRFSLISTEAASRSMPPNPLSEDFTFRS